MPELFTGIARKYALLQEHMFTSRKRLKSLEKEISLLRAQMSVSLFTGAERVIYSRRDFGYLFNYLGLMGSGAEVGVRKANYSCHLLSTWNGRLLYSIDPWKYYPDSEYVDGSNVEQSRQDKIYSEALKKLSVYGDRSEVIREESAVAAARFSDASLDFVYLDAQHHYEAVKEDIELWLPKVKSGGVISGDDYADVQERDNIFGVKRAVDEFVKDGGHDLHLTIDGLFPSWFVIK